tara:strand:+ start:2053 stop:3045 length:993 start_codon:yes stop_codon:yes gene_type:complete
MIDSIFIERDVLDHPVSQKVINRLKNADVFEIERYQEMFNRRQQNFRIQKQNPALILAKKYDNFVLPAPSGFGIDAQKNYYFSHMYNCIYDCRYCFLQGMYSSANYVLFVNYEDFFEKITDVIAENTNDSITFFSGYDCDSLAFEKITGFAEQAVEFFSNFNSVELELRTKSIVSDTLLKRSPISNCIVAYSLSPSNVASILDHKAPSVERRINALKLLAKNGWPVGLRFDPLIYCSDWKKIYSELFCQIFSDINVARVHSVSHGPLRYPKDMYKKISSLYPDDKLFSFPMEAKDGIVSYGKEIEEEMSLFLQLELEKYTTKNKIFRCLV